MMTNAPRLSWVEKDGHENASNVINPVDESGHVLGNFPAYYRFNPVSERLRFLNHATIQALQSHLLQVPEQDAGNPAVLLDVGCNEGNLTIALYRRLVGIDKFSESPCESEIESFDVSYAIKLNDLIQRQKLNICFQFETKEDERGQNCYHCRVEENGQTLAHGKGISKRVAKALAAQSALSLLTNIEQKISLVCAKKNEAQEEKTRRPLMVIGVDIDPKLIEKATMKTVEVEGDDVVRFMTGDLVDPIVSNRLLESISRENCECLKDTKLRLTLVTCFSVLMWIHINHGDDGAEMEMLQVMLATMNIVRLIRRMAHRRAEKRLKRLGQAVPKSFYRIQMRRNILEGIEHHLLAPNGQFRYRKILGVTQWDRPVILYSKCQIPSIDYDD